VGKEMLETTTVNVTLLPVNAVWLCGWVVMTGGPWASTRAGLTSNIPARARLQRTEVRGQRAEGRGWRTEV
jgi:hypothetical protein